MPRKKKTEPKPNVTYMLAKQDRLELHELYMVSLGQQAAIQQLGEAAKIIVQAGQQRYIDRLNEVKEHLGLKVEDQLFCNFVTGSAEVRNEPVEEPASVAAPTE